MKKIILSLLCAVATSALAQTATVVTTTTGTGTIERYEPGSAFILKETTGPVTYSYGPDVVYVTRSGRVLTEADLRTHVVVGRPASVHYVTEGERRIIKRVEVDDDDDDD